MKKTCRALLVLKDGTFFEGQGFGASGIRFGEAVFNTAMTGYQEILTDPSYFGQIVVMTAPQIGNTGVNAEDVESCEIFASGFVVKELSSVVSNYRARGDLDSYLRQAKVPGISGLDTRALVRHLRVKGSMPAVLAVGGSKTPAVLKKMAAALPEMNGQNLAEKVSVKKSYTFKKGVVDFIKSQPMERRKIKKRYAVAAYDFGIKKNILRRLHEHGFDVTVFPYAMPAEKILAAKKFAAVFLYNGPGDPAACTTAITNVKKILGKLPIFGICLGHQILALALGAKTYKLGFGHHGGNHPVKDLTTGHVEITSQNHNFAVDEKSLPSHLEVTHINLNDQTCEGLRHRSLPAFSVQYHPEAAPGPHDSAYLFERFYEMVNIKHS